METYDIAIIGLGPAGATVARLLDPKFKVVAFDKKSEREESFFKPCGGLLSRNARKMLAKFDLTLPESALAAPQIFSVKTLDIDQGLKRCYPRSYQNIDRQKFDLWLMSLIPAGVKVVAGAKCTDVKRVGAHFEISYIQNIVGGKIHARYVIGADGSNSLVRRALFKERKIRRYVAIQQWFIEKHPEPFYSCLFDKEATDSCAWSVSKDGHFILGGAFPKKDCRARFERLKEKLTKAGFLFSEPLKTEACLVSMPRKARDFCMGGADAFLVGEAAGLISPSSLEGISYALKSAQLLAEALNSEVKNPARKFRKKTFPMRVKLWLKNLKMPFMYNPFLRKMVMKSGIGSIKNNKE